MSYLPHVYKKHTYINRQLNDWNKIFEIRTHLFSVYTRYRLKLPYYLGANLPSIPSDHLLDRSLQCARAALCAVHILSCQTFGALLSDSKKKKKKKKESLSRENSHHCCKTNTAFSGVSFGILKAYIFAPPNLEFRLSTRSANNDFHRRIPYIYI